MISGKAETIDAYISTCPNDIQQLLQEIRLTIRKAAPDAGETISYAIPTFKQEGNLVHFAAAKNHIGFYPGPGAIEAFSEELSKYESSKGAVRFPLDKPMPLTLITKIVKYRVKQNLEKAALKKIKAKRSA